MFGGNGGIGGPTTPHLQQNNNQFPTNDIRRFATTRAVNSTDEPGPNEELKHTAFVTDRVNSQGEGVDGEGEADEASDDDEVCTLILDDKDDEKRSKFETRKILTTPPSEERRKCTAGKKKTLSN